jgi:hypothetical protein
MTYGVKAYREELDTFISSAELIHIFRKYEESEDYREELEELVKSTAKLGLTLPLPSGRLGNHVALALEIGAFNTTLYLLSNYDQLGLERSCYASSLRADERWTMKDHLESALYLYHDDLEYDTGKNDAIGYLKKKLNVK